MTKTKKKPLRFGSFHFTDGAKARAFRRTKQRRALSLSAEEERTNPSGLVFSKGVPSRVADQVVEDMSTKPRCHFRGRVVKRRRLDK